MPLSEPAFVASRGDIVRSAEDITVVICTREHPDGLDRCLKSVMRQRFPKFSVLVVDNAPQSTAASTVVAQFSGDPVKVDYVLEPRPGLARARNRALDSLRTGIAAWIDDDEVADPFWLAELSRGFASHPDAAAVSGIMLPAELETQPQVWFEQYGGHHKHRGFTPTMFSPESATEQSPLYPLPPFGTGGNMALRLDAVHEIGGFVTSLGAGTWSLGGEDTRIFTELLLAGKSVVYQPTAITHHYHRRSRRQLRRQMYGYGVGLTAFYLDVLVSRPASLVSLLRLAPHVMHDARGPTSLRSGDLPPDFPSDLRWANRLGLLAGPGRYAAARISGRRQARRARLGGTSQVRRAPRFGE
ncbi:MAG: glycosyltransferase family 2 protein [Candidatus Dormibacteria bacterium]